MKPAETTTAASGDAGNRRAQRRLRCATTVVALLSSLLASDPLTAAADGQPLTLRDLEGQLIASPELAAADTRIFGDDQEVAYDAARATGFNYFFQNDFGPRSDVVLGTQTNRTIRYGQLFGVDFPLFGTRLTEHLALAEAQSQANQARILSEGERRKLLGRLRESYIKFWQYDREAAVVSRFVALQKAEAPAAQTFLREGFWTQANYLGFMDGMTKFETDLSALRASRRSALADIRAIVNSDVPDVSPETPDLSAGCTPTLNDAVEIAVENDEDVARLIEQQNAARASLDFIRHSAITSDFRVGLGTDFDIPQHAVGYQVTGSFQVQFPQHMRPQESAQRERAYANLQMYHYMELQRRSEIRAAVMNVIDQSTASYDQYQQSKRQQEANRELLREARVREATIISTGAASFNEVQLAILESYGSARKEVSDLGASYISANAIETLVPSACVPFRLDGLIVVHK